MISDKKIERRYEVELRAIEDEEHGSHIVGVPIVFDEETDLGWFTEKIDRHALDEADMKDVRFLVNHNLDMIPLARSRNNNANSTMHNNTAVNVFFISTSLPSRLTGIALSSP